MTTETILTDLTNAIAADIKSINQKLKTFEFNQMIPASTWVIEHNLNNYPSVHIVDSAGSIVDGNIKYIDKNTIELTFYYPFSGKAYIN